MRPIGTFLIKLKYVRIKESAFNFGTIEGNETSGQGIKITVRFLNAEFMPR